MRSFLEQVADHYCGDLLQASRDTSRAGARQYKFVFASQRALLFFRHYLAKLAPEPMFAPRCETINDFILGLIPEYRLLDRTALLFELYQCYLECRGNRAEPFEDFIYWGNIILRDFDLVDRHLLSAQALYTNLSDYKELQDDFSYMEPSTRETIESFWQSVRRTGQDSPEGQVGYRESFMAFWLSLYPLYDSFTSRLLERHLGYEGLLYRKVADRAKDLVAQLSEQTRIVFVGLFELTPAEFKLLEALHCRGYGEFCWDEQACILSDPTHLASRILKRNKERLGAVLGAWSRVDGQSYLPQQVEVISCSSTVSQVKALPEILKQTGLDLDPNDELSTAIILPNDQLLLPVVGSIPSSYTHLNITLGYPLNRTPVAVFLNRWIALLLASRQSSYYRTDRLLAVLGLQLLTERYLWLTALADRVRRQKNFYVAIDWLISEAKDCYEPAQIESEERMCRALLAPKADAMTLLQDLLILLQDILDRSYVPDHESQESGDRPELGVLDAEFIHHYIRLINRLISLLQEYELDHSPADTAIQLLEGLAQSITIPFEGDPLCGLQIMGLLESRSLHFPRLIYLSAQEGQIPSGRQPNTLIPHTLRRGHRLPTHEWSEAAEAYRFYTAIARCRHLVLVYGQEDATGGKGEESRYIQQMEHLYGVPISRRTAQARPEAKRSRPITIDKRNLEIQSRLERYLLGSESPDHRELSASRLATYIQCPLRFCYEAILEVYEEQTPTELMAANDFGTILHSTMELIYKPYLGGKDVPKSYLEGLLELGNTTIDRHVAAKYEQIYGRVPHSALDKLYCDMIATYVRSIVAYDAAYEPITYLGSEQKLKGKIELTGGRQVHFKGDIDRLDIVQTASGERCLRVIDYKTGSDDKPYVYNLEQIASNPNRKPTLQVLLYCELVEQNRGRTKLLQGLDDLPIKPGVMRVRDMSHKSQAKSPYLETCKSTKESLILENYVECRNEYLTVIQEILEELFDLDRPFSQCADSKHCVYCPFALSCGR